MNIQQAKKVFTVPDVLKLCGFSPAKINGDKIFYFAIDGRQEKTASLLVNNEKAIDFGSSKSYDVISIVQEIKKCSVKEVLEFLEKQKFNSNLNFKYKIEISKNLEKKSSNKIKIVSIKKELNFSLKKYLLSRKISEQNFKYLKQVDYVVENNNSKFYAIGFKNNSLSFELRSKIFKGCNGKDITTILKQSKTINVFESFLDFLSFLEIFGNVDEDFLILNSTAMKRKACDVLKNKNYERIKIFTDADFSGDETCNYFLNDFKNATDERKILSKNEKKYKDLNDLLCDNPVK